MTGLFRLKETAMGQIKVTRTPIEGLYIIEPTVHGDARGYFTETYNLRDMQEAGLDMVFVQDNQSSSVKGVLRGLHFQINHPQGKLVRVIRGTVFDVAVDLREGSKTYGQWFGIELSEENHKQFYISEGFAHVNGMRTGYPASSWAFAALRHTSQIQSSMDSCWSLRAVIPPISGMMSVSGLALSS